MTAKELCHELIEFATKESDRYAKRAYDKRAIGSSSLEDWEKCKAFNTIVAWATTKERELA